MGTRYAPAERLLALGLALAEARGGLTLDQMAETVGVNRRTAERLRDTLHRLLPGGLLSFTRDDGTKIWRVPAGRLAPLQTPTLDELTELRVAADRARRQGLVHEAGRLDTLAAKLVANQNRHAFRRIDANLENLLAATGVVARPGPQETIAPEILLVLREAVLACHAVRLVYRRRDTGSFSYPILYPYGFLTGSRTYLVGFNPHPEVCEHRLYAIANIERVRLTGETFVRDETFDLPAYAARSFGAFWDGKTFDIVWRFAPEVAEDVRHFRFHPDQQITTDDRGRVTVTFRASGLTEMVWHLFTWGRHVEILGPEVLRAHYRAFLDEAATTLAWTEDTVPSEMRCVDAGPIDGSDPVTPPLNNPRLVG